VRAWRKANGKVEGTVLVIDDDETVLDIVRLTLQPVGLTVVSASSGREGLAALDSIKPDVVVLDVLMPEMNGWDVCRQIRAQSEVPVLFVTVQTGDGYVVHGLEQGADDFLTKPFDIDELRARVIALVGRARLAAGQKASGTQMH
jgi:two-component system OmpR family response regulator